MEMQMEDTTNLDETVNNNSNNNDSTINSNQLPVFSLPSIENVPAYSLRFSLCVLDVIRKLQQLPGLEKGVEKCYIVEYIRHLPFVDGDILSQVSIALRDLECNGYLMHMKNGYKTIGPFAKLCMAKTLKQRKILWKKFDMKFNHSYTDLSTIVSSSMLSSSSQQAKRCRRTKSETNVLIEQKNQINDDKNDCGGAGDGNGDVDQKDSVSSTSVIEKDTEEEKNKEKRKVESKKI